MPSPKTFKVHLWRRLIVWTMGTCAIVVLCTFCVQLFHMEVFRSYKHTLRRIPQLEATNEIEALRLGMALEGWELYWIWRTEDSTFVEFRRSDLHFVRKQE